MSKKRIEILVFLNQLDHYINQKIAEAKGVAPPVGLDLKRARVELEAALMELFRE